MIVDAFLFYLKWHKADNDAVMPFLGSVEIYSVHDDTIEVYICSMKYHYSKK